MQWLSEIICPSSYSGLAQVLISFSLGVLLSWWSYSLAALIFYLILYEALFYALMCDYRWDMMIRLGVVFAYLAGWLMARSLFYQDIAFLNTEDDHERLGESSLC